MTIGLTKYQERRALLWLLANWDSLCQHSPQDTRQDLVAWLGVSFDDFMAWDGGSPGVVPLPGYPNTTANRRLAVRGLLADHNLDISECADPTEGRILSPAQERQALEWIVANDGGGDAAWVHLKATWQKMCEHVSGLTETALHHWDVVLDVIPPCGCGRGSSWVKRAIKLLCEEHGVEHVVEGRVASKAPNVNVQEAERNDEPKNSTLRRDNPDGENVYSHPPIARELLKEVEEKLHRLDVIWEASRWVGPNPIDVVRARARVALAMGCPDEQRQGLEMMPVVIEWHSLTEPGRATTLLDYSREDQWIALLGCWARAKGARGVMDYTKALRALDEQLAILCPPEETPAGADGEWMNDWLGSRNTVGGRGGRFGVM